MSGIAGQGNTGLGLLRCSSGRKLGAQLSNSLSNAARALAG